ncbi:hypothetical protein I6F30_26545 [Bradyrhizobium sp. NBAIM20]|uniref:hypothetical protein n=1 Tax=unclassified Bradyrhizobium TaxID=2631580 RepID=UPI001CD49FF6|nr:MULTISPECIES: hypothetical protein [unclassified Bradyrhizobium]MCA1414669.1 hypothetical protein [Bradyrhizobium sp. NBAIM20]MCA1461858.1 hypothetical protein [Bradyrhizobium sp. NBAIM18]
MQETRNASSKNGIRVLVCSGFFESSLPSYREYSYSKELALLGLNVTLMCGDKSHIWSRSRVKLPVTNPTINDQLFTAETGVRLYRRKVFFRYSDFVLYVPIIRAIREADIVHVIEFRQGITAIVALLAKSLGKPVIYDHEQRGDRTSKWYSRVDSLFRRLFIFIGSLAVSQVRHTVLANRNHFRSCTFRRVPEMLAPLGADPKLFYFCSEERTKRRKDLGIADFERVAVITGKLHGLKKIADIVRACRARGLRLMLVGDMTDDVRDSLGQLPPGNEIVLPSVPTEQLRAVFNTADVAIYTTFTLSYWEALSTGISLVVPRTEFTELMFTDASNVSLFGNPEMFEIPDEQYRKDIDITSFISDALGNINIGRRTQTLKFSAASQAKKLAETYRSILELGA